MKMVFFPRCDSRISSTEEISISASAVYVTIAKCVMDFFYLLQCPTLLKSLITVHKLKEIKKMAKMIDERSLSYV